MAHAQRQYAAASGWRGWLEGSLKEKAQATVRELAEGLAVAQGDIPATTLAEIALFYGYLAEAQRDAVMAEHGLRYLNAAIDKVGRASLPPSFVSGYPQVGWVITQLAGRLFEPREADACVAIDEALRAYLQRLPQPAHFDLISGLAGVGVYALARMPAPSAAACLALTIQHLAERAERDQHGVTWHTPPSLLPEWQRQICPAGYYNLGLAHGVPGVIAFLARACGVAAVSKTAHALLEDAVRWMLAHAGEADGVPFFPNWVAPEVDRHRSRVAWCYGDLGAALALLYAARCVGRPDWEAQALPILRYAARNRGATAGVRDAGLCHGAAGNAHLFNRIYQATGEPLFQDAAGYWYAQVFDFHRPQTGIAGFTPYRPEDAEPGTWTEDADMFNGAVGIGLSLLAAISETAPAWDECLLVSLPPR
ncbi:MAG: lanthionine synthetase C family protein [Acidobacteria bacterium]|nr:lanthionine synthetase C family protein [Acidobacteriota bacterium]